MEAGDSMERGGNRRPPPQAAGRAPARRAAGPEGTSRHCPLGSLISPDAGSSAAGQRGFNSLLTTIAGGVREKKIEESIISSMMMMIRAPFTYLSPLRPSCPLSSPRRCLVVKR